MELLSVAFDSGVTHFDVARSYGYGDAESAVGEFAAGRRDELTIATKLGISVPSRSRRLDFARAAARRVVAISPRARRMIRRQADRLVRGGEFGLDAARRSLETSLSELRTDYVDLLLLHDCEPDDVTPDLLGFLGDRIDAGQIRSFGIATSVESAQAILAVYDQDPLVVQVPFHSDCIKRARSGSRAGLITHSVFAADLGSLHAELASGRVDTAQWSRRLDIDVTRQAEFGGLMLRTAVATNSDGTTLFSSRNREHIRANAKLADVPGPPIEQMKLFSELLKELRAPRLGPAERSA